MRTGLTFWRWRRNPLKRGTDRVEAWAVLVSSLMLVVGAPLAGVATGMSVASSGARPPADWHRVSAVLTERAPPPPPPDEASRSDQVRATVQWLAADGSRHRGLAWVLPDTPAGSRTTIWLDGTGTIRPDPIRAAQLRAVALGTVAAAGTVALAVCGFVLVHFRLLKRRESQLDREWLTVGRRWGPRRR